MVTGRMVWRLAVDRVDTADGDPPSPRSLNRDGRRSGSIDGDGGAAVGSEAASELV